MPVYRADFVFPADRGPIANGYVEVDAEGRIVHVSERAPADTKVTHLKGALVPGLINAHCHLELSHMRGRVDTGTGLLPFLKAVVTLRDVDPADIQHAIQRADADMWASGIQAVGDISNTADTVGVKAASPIEYYTFVEAFDFLQGGEMAKGVFAKAKETYDAHHEPKRLVPHAPYTVSPALFAAIREHNPRGGVVSIHNQETVDEDELFLSKTGGFLDFYRGFGFSLDAFSASAKTSLATTLPRLDETKRTLFVHNTQTTPHDLEAAQTWNDQTYWCTCPNANLYIENRLPRYDHWIESGVTACIGTDSLTSNWQLDLVEEMKAIQRYQSYVDTRTLVQWATLNGAEALGFDARLGSLSLGKVPGLVLIEGVDAMARLTGDSRGRRIL